MLDVKIFYLTRTLHSAYDCWLRIKILMSVLVVIPASSGQVYVHRMNI